jgi:hypothetical protein
MLAQTCIERRNFGGGGAVRVERHLGFSSLGRWNKSRRAFIIWCLPAYIQGKSEKFFLNQQVMKFLSLTETQALLHYNPRLLSEFQNLLSRKSNAWF